MTFIEAAQAAEQAMRAVIACSTAPVICSHTSIREPGDDNVRLMPAELAREIDDGVDAVLRDQADAHGIE